MLILFCRFSPIGIASIIAGKLMEVDDIGTLFADLGFYMLTVLLGLFIHGVFTLPLIYLVITRRNPLKLVKGVLQALLVAFGISSRCVYVCVGQSWVYSHCFVEHDKVTYGFLTWTRNKLKV